MSWAGKILRVNLTAGTVKAARVVIWSSIGLALLVGLGAVANGLAASALVDAEHGSVVLDPSPDAVTRFADASPSTESHGHAQRQQAPTTRPEYDVREVTLAAMVSSAAASRLAAAAS